MSWGEIKKAVNSNLKKPLNEQIENAVDEITLSGTENKESIETQINVIQDTLGNLSVVKSVQRGAVNKETLPSTDIRNIGIYPVDVAKSILITQAVIASFPNEYVSTGAITLQSNKITQVKLYGKNPSTFESFTWQVIEFY